MRKITTKELAKHIENNLKVTTNQQETSEKDKRTGWRLLEGGPWGEIRKAKQASMLQRLESFWKKITTPR